MKMTIPLRAALLGFETSFPHLDGHTVTVKRTGVTKPGQTMRIKGEGMPKHGFSSEFGDLVRARPALRYACNRLCERARLATDLTSAHYTLQVITFTVDFPASIDDGMAEGLRKLLPEFGQQDLRIGS
eukprot:scaffold152497_cov31-Tisochrysis_lutea.AAC.2